MAHADVEQVRVLFLNATNRLLGNEVVSHGSIAEAPLHARPILKRALELGATALIVVHNHPSGDPTPSPSDIDATRRLVEAARLLDIAVHDHLIIGHGRMTSFRERQLI